MDKETKLLYMLNGSSKVVGYKQVSRGLSEDTIRCVVVAEDADAELVDKVVSSAKEKRVEVLYAPSMEWLGRQAGIQVGAATVGIDKTEV